MSTEQYWENHPGEPKGSFKVRLRPLSSTQRSATVIRVQCDKWSILEGILRFRNRTPDGGWETFRVINMRDFIEMEKLPTAVPDVLVEDLPTPE